jgi:hypothetical protein
MYPAGIGWGYVVWFGLPQDMDKSGALLNVVMNIWVL